MVSSTGSAGDTLARITESLSDEKRRVVTSTARYLRIVASAGAGKTETITRRIIYLLARGAAPKSIIAFTFTERAAAEMKERIYRRVEEILGVGLCQRLGEMYIGTIHSFAMRLLQDHFGYGNHDVLDDNQEMAFVLRHGWSLGLGPRSKLAATNSYSENCLRFLNSVNVVHDELIELDVLAQENPDFSDEFKKYERFLAENKLITFGQMIKLARHELQRQPEVLNGFEHLVVDEYQDINKAQEELIVLLAERMTCYVVGDPRQCIYQWRGSDPVCFDRFKDRFSAETVEIGENRRSGKHIVDCGNAVARKFEETGLQAPMEPTRTLNGKPLLGVTIYLSHQTPSHEAEWVAKQITQLVPGTCDYGDIAVLLRSVSTSGPPIIDELKAHGIPYLVGGKVGLFKRDEAQALGRILAWCAEMFWQPDPYNWRSQEQGDTLLLNALALWPSKVAESELRHFKKALRDGEFQDLTHAYQHLLVLLGFLSWDPADPQCAARMANLGRFNTLLTDFESSRRRGGAKPNWPKDLESLVWFINSYATGAYEEQPAEDLRGQPAVQVMTVHQAKGLEWPIVFIPALVGNRFPSKNAGKSRYWYVSETLFDRKRYEGGRNDERKLFYVAATRARDGLCLSRFRRISNAASPSPFLAETGVQEEKTPLTSRFIEQVDKKATDDEEIVTYSATEIIEYIRCPYFYRLRHVWGYQPGLAELLGFGKSLHHVLGTLSQKAKSGMDPLQQLDALLDSDFHLPFADAGKKAALQGTARDKLRRYIGNHLEEIRATEEVEARLEFQLTKRATVTGRVDVIIGQGGERELRDYKTRDDSRLPDEPSLQLRLYALGLRRIGEDVQRASVAAIMEDKVSSVGVDEEGVRRAEEAASQAISGILEGQFKGGACQFCERCDYCSICRFKV